jgi:deoxyribodipyrimidine photo-lyase
MLSKRSAWILQSKFSNSARGVLLFTQPVLVETPERVSACCKRKLLQLSVDCSWACLGARLRQPNRRILVENIQRGIMAKQVKKDEASTVIEPERVCFASSKPVYPDRRYVLYWVQASPRIVENHALEYAIERANSLGKPLVACFGVTDRYPEANLRHYRFLLEGLCELKQDLRAKRGISLHVLYGMPDKVAAQCARNAACEVVTDLGYMRIQRKWRESLANVLDCRLTLVESECVVPVELASEKHEFAARTLRPRIWKHIQRFCVPLSSQQLQCRDLDVRVDYGPFTPLFDAEAAPGSTKNHPVDRALEKLDSLDRSVPAVSAYFRGGSSEAIRRLELFCARKLAQYAQGRNHPESDYTSCLSAYLHFGQISPITIAVAVWARKDAPRESKDAFIEELIVRRELSFNHCWYRPDDYDKLDSLPDWVHRTKEEHRQDPREHLYDLEALERADTHDPYWNAAQKEMMITGRMHGMMRMYWAKKVIEWTPTWECAYDWLIYLNNKYELDGRDANSFVGVLWSFGLHDRAHAERSIFGKLRWMSREGLERKFPMHAYLARVNALAEGMSWEQAAASAHAAGDGRSSSKKRARR